MADWCTAGRTASGDCEIRCERCGGRMLLVLPFRVSELLRLFDGFERLHGGCEERTARGGET